MDFDNVKVEKANAMLRYHRVRNIAKVFRLVEICLVLVILSWILARLPFAFILFGNYFRQLIAIIASPFFIFLLSNLIVITLFVNSRKLNTPQPNPIQDFVDKHETHINFGLHTSPKTIVYEDKHIVSDSDSNRVTLVADKVSISTQKHLQRTQSENMKVVCQDKAGKKLRRSETEICRKVLRPGETKLETVDKLSNEEFQRAIEAFIAKQVKFHREEKLFIVAPPSDTSNHI